MISIYKRITICLFLIFLGFYGYSAIKMGTTKSDSPISFSLNIQTETSIEWIQFQPDNRTPIDVLDSDGDGSVIISQPGHYYLRDSLVVTKVGGDGIRINSDNVTIDLNGFALIAGPQSTDQGITLLDDHNNITIKNGMVKGFDDDGIYAVFADQSTFRNLIVKDNGGNGIIANHNCLVIDCVALNNGDEGIEVDNGSIIRNCTVAFNGDNGIQADDGCIIYNCISYSNSSDGILTNGGSLIENCTVYDNNDHGLDLGLSILCHNNNIYRNGWNGIDLSGVSLIINNISNSNGTCITNGTCGTGTNGQGLNTNQGAGIRTFANAAIIRNQCIGNYYGIAVSSTDSKIIGNDMQKNSHAGIISTSSGCLHIKNTAHGNGFEQSPSVTNLDNYPLGDIVFGGIAFTNGSIGPIINVIGAGDISTLSGTDHPFANFIY